MVNRAPGPAPAGLGAICPAARVALDATGPDATSAALGNPPDARPAALDASSPDALGNPPAALDATSPDTAPAAPDSKPPAPTTHSGVPAATYVLGGIGVAALATGVVFRAIGAEQYNALAEDCGTACTDAQVDPVKAKYTISNISLGVGAGALVAGGVMLAEEALAAQRTGNGDAAGRIAIARGFAENLAVQSSGIERSVTEGSDSILGAGVALAD